MRNNNYLSLINFKEKLYRQRIFFINEHDAGCSNWKKKLNIQHSVHLKRVSDDEDFTWKLIRPK